MEQSIYNFRAKTINGKDISMEQYRGKVVVVVNTASKCGFTPQYADLNTLYSKYKDYGFEILGFPCNQFGNQEPGDSKQISEGCLLNYGVSFQMFDKVLVNGDGAHPLFKFIKRSLPGFFGGRIVWNFTKFIFDANGKPLKRFAPITSPLQMEELIRKQLGLD